ncbi:hypothetical protein DHC50_01835 [Arenibacter sp. A80]|nr:hypothetical protein [Arenibacter sp. A80]RFT57927.1 hypothetical protein D0S24_01835 [Arenibacter sp. P308M17]
MYAFPLILFPRIFVCFKIQKKFSQYVKIEQNETKYLLDSLIIPCLGISDFIKLCLKALKSFIILHFIIKYFCFNNILINIGLN